jgi:hypothetical protein
MEETPNQAPQSNLKSATKANRQATSPNATTNPLERAKQPITAGPVRTPTIAAVLVDREDLTLITIGGQVNPLVGAGVDGGAFRQILGMRPDLLLLGKCATDAD